MPSVWSRTLFPHLANGGVTACRRNPYATRLPTLMALSTLPTMRLPPAPGPGARVALIAPAGPLRPDELDASIAHASSLGWEPVPGLHVLRREGYLAGSDAERALDLNVALQDDGIDGIWCARGGYGAMRLLRDVDYDAMRR